MHKSGEMLCAVLCCSALCEANGDALPVNSLLWELSMLEHCVPGCKTASSCQVPPNKAPYVSKLSSSHGKAAAVSTAQLLEGVSLRLSATLRHCASAAQPTGWDRSCAHGESLGSEPSLKYRLCRRSWLRTRARQTWRPGISSPACCSAWPICPPYWCTSQTGSRCGKDIQAS